MSWFWFQGEWIPGGSATVPVTDRCWTHGLGLFETILAVDGRPAFLSRHLARLHHSCGIFGWEVDLAAAAAAVPELLLRNGLDKGRARVRLAVSGGEGALDAPDQAVDRKVSITTGPAVEAPESLVVGKSSWLRNASSPLAGHKCASYAENLFLLQDAKRQGWDEVLVFTHDGQLCEAAMANVFVVLDGELVTPCVASGCLPGVTRGVVLELAAELQIPFREGVLTADDLGRASAAFLTSATRGPVRIGALAGRELADDPLVSALRRAWEMAVRRG